MRFENQVAVVTGAAKGIGRGIATVFAREGPKVVVVDWDADAGERTAAEIVREGGDAIFVQCDVSNEEQVKAMVQATLDKYRRLDVLVNNAGIGVYKSVLDASSEDWDRAMAVNLKGVFLCSKYAIPHMQELGKGVDAMSANISTAATDADAQTLVNVTQQTLSMHLGSQQQTVAIEGRAGYCRVEIVGPNWRLWSQAENGKIVDHGATISGK